MTAALDLYYAGDARPDSAPAARALGVAAPALVPDRREHRPTRPLATVTALRPPAETRSAAPIRLTRRGVVALSLVVAALSVTVVWLALASAPSQGATSVGPVAGDQAVTVRAGDTLWSIATRVAPARDPRSEVSALQRVNRLRDVDVVPGQVLRVP